MLATLGEGVKEDSPEAKALKYLIDNFTCRKSTLKDPTSHKNWDDAWAMVTGKGVEGGGGAFSLTNTYAPRGMIKDLSETSGNIFVLFPVVTGNFTPVKIKDYRAQLLEYYPPIGYVHRAGTLAPHTVAIIGAEYSTGDKRTLGESDVGSRSKRQATEGETADFAQAYIGSRRTRDVHGGADLGKLDLAYSSTHRNFTVNGKDQAVARKAGNLPTSLQRILAYCLYHSKINSSSLQAWANNNIVLPVSILIARPFMTYDMCTCIMMRGGTETGQTFQGHSDFQLGDDVQSKIHYGNYTYYSTAVVTNPKNIIHARNVYANGYVDGDDTEWIDSDQNTGERKGGSMYAFIVPYDEHKKENPMRLFENAEYGDDRPTHRKKFGRTMTGHRFYSNKLGVSGLMPEEQFTTLSERNDTNDITYTGHHFWWKEHREGGSAGSYTGTTHNTGHWGRDVYPGCGRVRNGEEVYLEKQNHGQEVY